MYRAALLPLISAIALSASAGHRVTGGDNAYYLPEPSTAQPGTLEFSWPESHFKGGDGYNGPTLPTKPFKVYVTAPNPQGGDNQNSAESDGLE